MTPGDTAADLPADLVVLTLARSALEARAIAAIVREAGVGAVVLERDAAGFDLWQRPGAGAVPVHVPGDDLDAARAALREHEAAAGEVSWDEVDVGARVDEVPSRTPGRMPLLARIAFAVALAAALLGVIGAVAALVL